MNPQSTAVLLTMLLGLLLVGTSAFAIWQHIRPWHPPMRLGEKVFRSFGTGLGVTVGMFSFLALLDLSTSPEAVSKWSISSLLTSLCFVAPFAIATTIGSFVGLGITDTLRGRAQVLAQRGHNSSRGDKTKQ